MEASSRHAGQRRAPFARLPVIACATLGVYSRRFSPSSSAIDIFLPCELSSAAAARRASAELTRFAAPERMPKGTLPVMNLTALGAASAEQWLATGPLKAVEHGSFSGLQTGTFLWLQACVEIRELAQMRELAGRLYTQLLAASRALGMSRFVRIWNYVPEINCGQGDAEVYRQFCWGRADSLADTELPAATGIGSHDGWLRIGALCTHAADQGSTLQLTHMENPRQLSAWRYPRAYGPRSPSFARATLVTAAAPETDEAQARSATTDPGARGLLLLSGTSSIVHHQTRHAGNLALQTQETATNINALFATLPRQPRPLAMRYYLRDKNQLAEAQAHWASFFPGWREPAFYHADICRADLDMEIEGVFSV